MDTEEQRASREARSREEIASEAWGAIFELVFEGEGQRRFFEACESTGLTPAVLKALMQLDAQRPLPMRDLVGIFHCDPSWVTSVVDGLEAAGLAERRLLPTDRRVKVVVPSELGVQTKQQVRKLLSEPPASFANLSADELVALRDLLAKLKDDPS